MKRFSVLLASAVFGCALIGCGGGGIEEGMPKEGQNEVMPAQFKSEMEKNANKMIMKKPAGASSKPAP